MRVQKRNGDLEEVSFDKILKRIQSLCSGPEFNKKLNIIQLLLLNEYVVKFMMK